MKRMYIRKRDVLEHGMTEGCPGCNAIKNNKKSMNHTDACRQRIEAKISESEGGKRRIQENENRQNEVLARRLEDEEKRRRTEDPKEDERGKRIKTHQDEPPNAPAESSKARTCERPSAEGEDERRKRIKTLNDDMRSGRGER